jgi:hypothetical protein
VQSWQLVLTVLTYIPWLSNDLSYFLLNSLLDVAALNNFNIDVPRGIVDNRNHVLVFLAIRVTKWTHILSQLCPLNNPCKVFFFIFC